MFELPNKIIVIGRPKYVNDFSYVFMNYFSVTIERIIVDSIEKYSVLEDIIDEEFVVICDDKYSYEAVKKIRSHNTHWMEDLLYLLDDKDYNDSSRNKKPLASEMMKKTIYAKSLKKMPCEFPFTTVAIGPVGGTVGLCECPGVLPAGHLLDKSISDIWNSSISIIYRLSMINQTYSFCVPRSCRYDLWDSYKHPIDYSEVDVKVYQKKAHKNPIDYRIAHSGTCNLHCKQCRNDIYADDGELLDENMRVSQVLIESMVDAETAVLAGNGEVFSSKAYKLILDNLDKYMHDGFLLRILSNGNLMDPQIVDKLIKDTKGNIDIAVSVDAANEATYRKNRSGGNWGRLMTNLKYVGEKCEKKEIKGFTLNYVVQQNNVAEMADFVRLGKKLGATMIFFTAIYNTGTYDREEFENVGILNQNGEIKEELRAYFNDPVLKSPNVFLPYGSIY